MKLIDILVEELPKRGGWPKHAEKYCSYNGEAGAYKRGGIEIKKALITGIDTQICEVVYAEQYEAALADKNEGWIEWGGGECPVQEGVLVKVKYRNEKDYHIKGTNCAWRWSWEHYGTDGDIIAYRLHNPQEAVHGEAGDEANLNECIGQDATPVWNGKVLPPVGCECEVDYGSVELIDGLSRPDDGDVVRVVSHEKTGFGTQVVVVYWNGVNGGGRAHALIPKCLRPLRTDAERKRDAAVEIMTQILCSPSQASATAKKIYDAIAAGKIPGVKLED